MRHDRPARRAQPRAASRRTPSSTRSHPLWPHFQTRRPPFLLVPSAEGGASPSPSLLLAKAGASSSPHWRARLACLEKELRSKVGLRLASPAPVRVPALPLAGPAKWAGRRRAGEVEGQGLARPEVSAIKFLQGGRARGESWSSDPRRRWRDPGADLPAARCGDSMRPW